MTTPNKLLQPTRDDALSFTSRFTSFAPAWLNSSRSWTLKRAKGSAARPLRERTLLACSFPQPAENFVALISSRGRQGESQGDEILGEPPKTARGPRALSFPFHDSGLTL